MAKKWSGNTKTAKNKGKKGSYEKDIKNFAYKMGCVQRGLSNPDSQVAESFNAGKNKTPQKKKPLF